MRIILTVGAAVLGIAVAAAGQAFELIRYGDFENWVTRNITESKIIGGDTKQVYEIAPNATVNGDAVYKPMGGSPWATSNIMAKVVGITKTSNAVFPDRRAPGNRCCKLQTIMEHCKGHWAYQYRCCCGGFDIPWGDFRAYKINERPILEDGDGDTVHTPPQGTPFRL